MVRGRVHPPGAQVRVRTRRTARGTGTRRLRRFALKGYLRHASHCSEADLRLCGFCPRRPIDGQCRGRVYPVFPLSSKISDGGFVKLERLLQVSFVLMIAAGGLFSCGENKDVGRAAEGTAAQVFGQDIQLEGPLPRFGALQSVKVPVSVRNTSNFSWTPSGDHPVRFAYHWFDKDGRKVVHDGERTFLVVDLPAGSTAKLSATVTAPPAAGDYTLRFTLVQEGVAWFDDEGAKPVEIPVKVEGQ